jgi:hypothetical protein
MQYIELPTDDIEVTECLTDCHSCTGLYVSEVLNSRILCRCTCLHKNKKVSALGKDLGPDSNAISLSSSTEVETKEDD